VNAFYPDVLMSFGTQANFDLYNIPTLVVSSAQAFTMQNRLWISGDQGLYTSDNLGYAAVAQPTDSSFRTAHLGGGWLPRA
jgi:hypothetical protein